MPRRVADPVTRPPDRGRGCRRRAMRRPPPAIQIIHVREDEPMTPPLLVVPGPVESVSVSRAPLGRWLRCT